MAWIGLLFFILLDILQPRCLSHAKTDTLKQGEQLLDSDRLISANGVYSVQFFSLDLIKKISPSPRYVGICFSETISSDSASVVWVANIYNPSPDTSGVLSIDTDGILKITYSGRQPIVVSSNQGTKSSKSNITATILDSGNLVLREAGYNGMVGPVLWQSFDYPTEVLLPEMKLGFNLKTGHEWYLSSWLSPQLPCPGAFRLGLDPNGSSQLIVWRRGEVYWKSGLWKSGSFSQAPELTKLVGQYEFKFVKNENESYFHFTARNRSTLLIWQLSYWGSIFLKILDLDGSTIHKLESIKPCNRSTNNRTAVCLNEKPSKCRAASEFFDTIKGYMDQNDWGYNDYNSSLARPDCHTKCWKNCSCIAYKSAFSNGSGCTFWARGSNFFPNNESLEEFYLLHSEFNRDSSSGGKTKNERSRSIKRWWLIWTILAVVLAIALLASAILCHLRRSQGKLKIIHKESLVSFTSAVTTANNPFDGSQLKKGKRKEEFQMFSFLQITAATNNFSSSCKLGEGGFGPVYKGILPNGLQFAVKRLSRTSGQGLVEFENEITLIAELQHMNLVTLLGYCIEGDEKMLIYEYMPNKSLDSFLFDPIKRRRLEWKTRFNIIEGIAQGLLYLHKYSRLRIIHRDLKASNILLDDQMNPKISDFGLARIFGHTDYEANTKRVVGTYGYMSPEYAMNGIFSAKSDVYSFGVLLLEIISGLRNTAFSLTSGPLTLIEHAWNLWSTDACLDLVDKSLGSSCPENDILRCVHVSLLCVQECAMDRPTMSEVAIMLTNESMSLPYPNQPPSYVTRSGNGTPLPDRKSDPCSVYSVSVTEMEGR